MWKKETPQKNRWQATKSRLFSQGGPRKGRRGGDPLRCCNTGEAAWTEKEKERSQKKHCAQQRGGMSGAIAGLRAFCYDLLARSRKGESTRSCGLEGRRTKDEATFNQIGIFGKEGRGAFSPSPRTRRRREGFSKKGVRGGEPFLQEDAAFHHEGLFRGERSGGWYPGKGKMKKVASRRNTFTLENR